MNWLDDFVEIARDRLSDREREALWTRGVSDQQIDLYQIGYVNQRLPELEYSAPFLEWCWRGKRLRDMFVLPLTNTLGQVRGLQFRHVDPAEKGYSDYTPYEDEPITFGLVQAVPHMWSTGSVWLVEGAFDVFPIQRVYPSVVPTLTNRLTDPMVRLLKRLVTDLWLAFDMDDPGRKAVRRTAWKHRQDFIMHEVPFPRPRMLDGQRRVKDPSELWETWGDSQLEKFLRNLQHGD